MEIGKINKIWQTDDTNEVNKNLRIKFQEDQFMRYLDFVESQFIKLHRNIKARENTIHLKYEEITKNPPSEQLCEFFEIKKQRLTTPLLKQNSNNVIERFSNPDVVVEYVTKLGKAEWLEKS